MVDGLSHNAYDHSVDGITAHVSDCIKTAARSLATSINTMSLSPSLPTVELSSVPLIRHDLKGSNYDNPAQ